MITLYYARGTCALASHLALEYAGAEYRTVRIDFAKKEQRSLEYLRLNPKGRVPALLTERGVLTETPALLQFISQSFPEAKLAPLHDHRRRMAADPVVAKVLAVQRARPAPPHRTRA